MKRNIFISIILVLMIVCAVVFANNKATKNSTGNCPDRPGCICSKPAKEQIVLPKATAEKKDICPNTPGCICKK